MYLGYLPLKATEKQDEIVELPLDERHHHICQYSHKFYKLTVFDPLGKYCFVQIELKIECLETVL